MKNENEQRIRIKISIFKSENKIVHLKKYNGSWYNGRIFLVKENYLMINDREDGLIKVYFIDIKDVSEFEVRE